jgi:hypothetical protein
MDQLEFIADWGGQFVVPIPELRVYEASKKSMAQQAQIL